MNLLNRSIKSFCSTSQQLGQLLKKNERNQTTITDLPDDILIKYQNIDQKIKPLINVL
jgi:hypothetical protein